MEIHKEQTLSRWSVILLITTAFILIYQVWMLNMQELHRDEGIFAAITQEIVSFPPNTVAHGEPLRYFYPLYPLLTRGLTSAGWSVEFSLRLLSVLPLAGLTLLVGIACFRLSGLAAAAAGACAVFTNFIAAEKGIEGYPQMLSALLLYAGWLLFFHFVQVRNNWNRAWFYAGLFGALCFYNGGLPVLLLFLLPLCFMRRPLTIWKHLRGSGFWTGAVFLAGTMILWLIPRWELVFDFELPPAETFLKYIGGFLSMPFSFSLRFLPWTFFLYAPFCPALTSLDNNPLFTRYMKTIAVVVFLALWVNPFREGRDLIYLIAPLATLAGLFYEIAARKFGSTFCTLGKWFGSCFFFWGLGLTLLYVIPTDFWLRHLPKMNYDVSFKEHVNLPAVLCCAEGVSLFAAAGIFSAWRKKQVWLIILLLFTSLMLCFWGLIYPYRVREHERRDTGMSFRKAFGENFSPEHSVLYKDKDISGLYAECCYFGGTVRHLPKEAGSVKDPEVFLLSASSIQPADASRTWSKVQTMIYKKQELYIWKGSLNERNNGQTEDLRSIPF